MRLAPKDGHDILKRTQDFSKRIVKLCEAIPKNSTGRSIAGQLARSGTSIGAHMAEANFAKSRADFVSKLDGALQESEETRYWIELLADTGMIKPQRLQSLLGEISEIKAIVVTIANKVRQSGTS